MSKKYAIHKFDFMYNDEWYCVDHHSETLYDIVDDEKTARQRWAALERDSLEEYPLDNLSTFANGELSEEQYQQIISFIQDDCGLQLTIPRYGFCGEDIPTNQMNDEQLLTFLEMAQSNHYMVKEYTASRPRYVIFTAQHGYMLQDPSGYSDQIWFTHDGSNVMEQYRKDAYIGYGQEIYEKQTILTTADLENPIVKSLISQYQNEVSIDYNVDKTEGEIDFSDSPDTVITAFNAVLQMPIYLVQQVDDVVFTQISQEPSMLIR